jgi:hypothetical protein
MRADVVERDDVLVRELRGGLRLDREARVMVRVDLQEEPLR